MDKDNERIEHDRENMMHRDEPTTFFACLLAGTCTGVLFAAQSGARTCGQLHSLAEDLQEETSQMLGDAKISIGKHRSMMMWASLSV